MDVTVWRVGITKPPMQVAEMGARIVRFEERVRSCEKRIRLLEVRVGRHPLVRAGPRARTGFPDGDLLPTASFQRADLRKLLFDVFGHGQAFWQQPAPAWRLNARWTSRSKCQTGSGLDL